MSCPTDPATASPAAKSCLIVDDSRSVRYLARHMLQQLNFVVEEAVDGRVALEFCQRNMPAAILLDWNMPVLSGIDFLRELRSVAGGEAPVVVFCTTMSDVGHIKEALGAGANDYIMKPFDAEVLHEKFAKLGLL